MYVIVYKGLYVHIFCRVFLIGLMAMDVVAIFLAWVWATHHMNS